MNKSIILILSVTMLCLVGCATSAYSSDRLACKLTKEFKLEVTHDYDEFDKVTSNALCYNFLEPKDTLPLIEINISRRKKEISRPIDKEVYGKAKYEVTYFLSITYWDNDWLFIDSDESLALLVDGKKITLQTNGIPVRNILSGDLIQEAIPYPVSSDLLKKICFANEVKIKISGKRSIKRQLTKENLANLQQFYKSYILKDSADETIIDLAKVLKENKQKLSELIFELEQKLR